MSVERDLLEQEWTGVQQIMAGVAIDKHIRDLDVRGEVVRVTIEVGEDEQTRAVFYGTPDEARVWLGDLEDEIDQARDDEDARDVATEVFEAGADRVAAFVARGWGDLEAGYQATMRDGRAWR